MNKNIALLFVLLSTSGLSQTWAPPGAVWYYESGFPDQNGYLRVTYDSDTMLDGRMAQKTISELFWFSIPLQQYLSFANEGGNFTAVENDVVYIWNYQQWDTLFWFGAAPGDSWILTTEGEQICEGEFVVTDTGSVEVDGQELRSIVITPQFDQPWVPQVTAIEHIGSLEVVWFTMMFCGTSSVLPLRCYSDNNINYGTGIAPSCDFVLGTSEMQNDQLIRLYPNPGESIVRIELPAFWDTASLLVTDAFGRIVRKEQTQMDAIVFDAEFLPAGVYTITLISANGLRLTSKWVRNS